MSEREWNSDSTSGGILAGIMQGAWGSHTPYSNSCVPAYVLLMLQGPTGYAIRMTHSSCEQKGLNVKSKPIKCVL